MANDARSNAAGAVAQNVKASDWLNNITQNLMVYFQSYFWKITESSKQT
jgi:hypothetical protein